jgi:hypothetical protein
MLEMLAQDLGRSMISQLPGGAERCEQSKNTIREKFEKKSPFEFKSGNEIKLDKEFEVKWLETAVAAPPEDMKTQSSPETDITLREMSNGLELNPKSPMVIDHEKEHDGSNSTESLGTMAQGIVSGTVYLPAATAALDHGDTSGSSRLGGSSPAKPKEEEKYKSQPNDAAGVEGHKTTPRSITSQISTGTSASQGSTTIAVQSRNRGEQEGGARSLGSVVLVHGRHDRPEFGGEARLE